MDHSGLFILIELIIGVLEYLQDDTESLSLCVLVYR